MKIKEKCIDEPLFKITKMIAKQADFIYLFIIAMVLSSSRELEPAINYVYHLSACSRSL